MASENPVGTAEIGVTGPAANPVFISPTTGDVAFDDNVAVRLQKGLFGIPQPGIFFDQRLLLGVDLPALG